jgi:hypothetical protein
MLPAVVPTTPILALSSEKFSRLSSRTNFKKMGNSSQPRHKTTKKYYKYLLIDDKIVIRKSERDFQTSLFSPQNLE